MTCPVCGQPATSAERKIVREVVDSEGWSVPEPAGDCTYRPCGCVVSAQVARP